MKRASVSRIASDHGARLRRRRLGKAQREQIVELYRSGGYSEPEVARLVGCSASTVHEIVSKMLAPDERLRIIERVAWTRRKYQYRRDLFTDPLSDAELWLFGLLLADGTTDGRYLVRLELSARDRDAVESARRVAESDAPVVIHEKPGLNPYGGRSGPLASWSIHSREIVSRVTALGMVRAKSNREDVRVPKAVALRASFWRGVIDGDGTIRWIRPGSGARRYGYVQVLGGRLLLKQWASFVLATIGEPTPGIRPAPSGKFLHVSTLSASRAWRMLEVLYGQDGEPALERKRKVALEILASPKPMPRPKPVDADVVELALAELGNVPLGEVPRTYVCPRTGVRLGQVLSGARRRGHRPDLHALFEKHDSVWRVSRLGATAVPVDLVQLALAELGDLPVRRVPATYACPRTGVRLGVLVRNARRGGRPDLHELFEKHDPEWRSPKPQAIPVDLVQLALAELGNLPLRGMPNRYVCPRTGVRLGQLLSRARRHGYRSDLHALFDRHDLEWRQNC